MRRIESAFPHVLLAVCLWLACPVSAAEVTYGVGDWPESFGSHPTGTWPTFSATEESFGNHRARIRVAEKSDAVWVHIPWRRRDAKPENKEIIVVDAATNKRVENVLRVNVQRESGDLLFQPVTVPGEYYVYYLPYKNIGLVWYRPTIIYTAPTNTANADWAKACQPLAQRITAGDVANIPAAKVLELQAINDFHRFDPMEVVATAEETKNLLAANPGKPYLLFPEDRRYPIRMNDALPRRWVQAGPGSAFQGEACRGEFYAIQIGVYAANQDLDNVRVSFTPLGFDNQSIPVEAMRCFNTGGTDWLGRTFVKTVHVAKGRVQPLWIGVQVPKDAAAGVYQGSVVVTAKDLPDAAVKLSLTVADKVLEDAGDGEPWRHSRLRWLDSKIGLDDDVVAPYTPVAVTDRTVSILGRRARFVDSGLLDSVQSTFGYSVDRIDSPPREMLADAMKFVVETAAGPLHWTSDKPKIVFQSGGAVGWEAASKAAGMELLCSAKMECDGYVNFHLTLRAAQAADLKDVRLEIPLRRDVARYMMGMGCKGGRRPPQWQWKWNPYYANNQLWIGDVNAGINCKLKHTEDRWDLYNLLESGTYKDWSNGGQGGCNVSEEGEQVVVRAYTGPRKVAAGEELHFNFGLLITPVKALDKGYWQWRYFQALIARPVPEVATNGATIINLHQGDALNPHINYPFRTVDKLAAYAADAHVKGIKVKIYYTVRELSNYTTEFWALRSLGNEVFLDGPGFHLADQFAEKKPVAADTPTGSAWLCEHAVAGYVVAWQQPLSNGHMDAAIATTGLSRWHNYYLEGLAWLVKNVGVDGLYLDGIGYDREIMKRVRKVLDRARPGCLIDFHSGNNFTPASGLGSPANQYMELFPYIDSLWFGELYDYNETPDYWLVEISGIPYGLFGEMLDNGNPWRGMVYGMTNRLGWGTGGGDPRLLWKQWDDFGIQEARMIGYWDPACPVRTDHKDVLATVYVKQGKTLVAVASWAKEKVACRLKIDFAALGLDRLKIKLRAPALANFQDAATFDPSDAIPVEPGHGWLLVLE